MKKVKVKVNIEWVKTDKRYTTDRPSEIVFDEVSTFGETTHFFNVVVDGKGTRISIFPVKVGIVPFSRRMFLEAVRTYLNDVYGFCYISSLKIIEVVQIKETD